MVTIRLIGAPSITDATGAPQHVRGKKPWAVLARILMADRPLSRSALSAELFPDADDPLGSLRWCLASLRKSIGSADVLTGDPLTGELPDWIWVDVDHLDTIDLIDVGVGELLEGIEPPGGHDFSIWLLIERRRVAARIAARLCDATITATALGEHQRSVQLAGLAARRAPYEESTQILLATALVAAGSPADALQHVRSVEALFRDDLGCDPTPALRSSATRLDVPAPRGVAIAQATSTESLTQQRDAKS